MGGYLEGKNVAVKRGGAGIGRAIARATAAEGANVMVFHASDPSGYMTGEVVSVSSQHP